MKCPDCKDGKGMIPALVSWAPEMKPKTDAELAEAFDKLSTCRRCGGTQEIPDEMAQWIEDGEALRKLREERGFGPRGAATKIGINPGDLFAMELGNQPVDPDVVERVKQLKH